MALQGIPRQQACGINRRKIGDVAVTMINDGSLDLSFDLLSDNITEAEAKDLLRAANLPPVPRLSVNTYVIQDGRRTTLIDGGGGGYLGWGGRLQYALSAANIDASQIDTILLTHVHPDHIGGLTAHGATPLFLNAELVLHAAELQFWRDDDNFREAPSYLQMIRSMALNTLDAYRSVTRTSTGGEVIEGVTMQPHPGHTPGHSGYLIRSGRDSVLIWGDVAHWPSIQIPRPDVAVAFDHDRDEATKTRKHLIDMAATDNILIGGVHVNFPGFIRIQRNGHAYRIIEERWSPDLV